MKFLLLNMYLFQSALGFHSKRLTRYSISSRWIPVVTFATLPPTSYSNSMIRGDQIKVTIQQFGPLGATVKINGLNIFGLVLQKEIALFRSRRNEEDVIIGETIDGYVERIRDDGRVDVSLRPVGISRTQQLSEEIYKAICESPTKSIPLGDKSDPDEVSSYFYGTSKRDFKTAIGLLYKEGKVKPSEYLTTLLDPSQRRISISKSIPEKFSKLHVIKGDIHTIFIGNLPFKCNEVSVMNALDKLLGINIIKSIRLQKDESGRCKGYGYIDIPTTQSIEDILPKIKGFEFMGRQLRVDYSDPSTSSRRKENPSVLSPPSEPLQQAAITGKITLKNEVNVKINNNEKSTKITSPPARPSSSKQFSSYSENEVSLSDFENLEWFESAVLEKKQGIASSSLNTNQNIPPLKTADVTQIKSSNNKISNNRPASNIAKEFRGKNNKQHRVEAEDNSQIEDLEDYAIDLDDLEEGVEGNDADMIYNNITPSNYNNNNNNNKNVWTNERVQRNGNYNERPSSRTSSSRATTDARSTNKWSSSTSSRYSPSSPSWSSSTASSSSYKSYTGSNVTPATSQYPSRPSDRKGKDSRSYSNNIIDPVVRKQRAAAATLFVGNLDYDTTSEDLRKEVERYCGPRTVTSVRIASDRETGNPKGFAYVDFSSDDDAKKVYQDMHGAMFRGRPLNVDEATR